MNVAFDPRLQKAPSQSMLRFACSPDGETYLAEQLLRFPYHITRVHRAVARAVRADLCLQALGGGLVEGDNIRLAVALGAEARARLTTQSSNKIHSMRGGRAVQQVNLSVASGGWLEYLPRPLILFPDSHSGNRTRVTLEPGGGAVVVDAFYPYDPSGNGRAPLHFTNTVEVHDADGRLLVRDALAANADDFRRSRLLRELPCQASVFLLGQTGESTVLQGYRYHTEHAELACSRLPNNAGWCLRGFVSGAGALRRVVDELLRKIRPASRLAVDDQVTSELQMHGDG